MKDLKRKAIAVLLASVALMACSDSLTEREVQNYIIAYRGIRAVSPLLAQTLGKESEDPKKREEEFKKLVSVITQSGFSGFQEFVEVNGKVAWAFSQAQAGLYSDDLSQRIKDGVAEIDEALKNPDLSVETRNTLIMNRENILATHKRNSYWAELVMTWTGKLTDKKSIEVVKKYRKELEAAFMGQ